jgi:[acyl-carrier-protein] S-malonyltransferase
MVEASERLGELLDTMELKDAGIPIVNNADAIFLTNADAIKRSLITQLNSPLLWEDSIRTIAAGGVDTFIEVGPGRVLSGLIKRIEPSARLLNVGDMKSLEATLKTLEG